MKTRARRLLPRLGLTVLLWCPAGLTAQAATAPDQPSPGEPRFGEEVVVVYNSFPGGPLLRSYLSTVRGDFIMVRAGYVILRTRRQTIAIDTTSVRSFRRQIGTKPASAPAMVAGSAAGFAAGFLLGAMTYRESSNPASTTSSFNRGLASGVLLGAPAGALIAWLASRARPIYEDLGIAGARPSLAVNPSGRVRLSLTVAGP